MFRKSIKISITGRVQGVGFRPFVYSLAIKYQLTGIVQNNLDGVLILAEGEELPLSQMVAELKEKRPRLAIIRSITVEKQSLKGYTQFSILQSDDKGGTIPWMPTDTAICDNCLLEMSDPTNRRYQYAFTNCTQCGPRYTIISKLPYDRTMTTMNSFKMCKQCQKEYDDPMNRRHHAQPICCSDCGPTISLSDDTGNEIASDYVAITKTQALIKQGKLITIKGVGGFHLTCDAHQKDAISRLREMKKRPQRPLAVMVKSIDVAKKICLISKKEEAILKSPEMPIVILQKRKDCPLPNNLSPHLSTLGVMLPYTPLHHLLFDHLNLEFLVMTSANPSGLPIYFKDEELPLLQNLSDYTLYHNRPIEHPIDDSVVQCDGEGVSFIRRARGYTPDPLLTKANVDQIIALGGNQKNTFAIGKPNHIVMSGHIGDLDSEEMVGFYKKQQNHFKNYLCFQEKYAAIDKHPEYETTLIGNELKGRIISVQHHHAHHVSCMADNGLEEPCLGIILDGTGYGEDGHIWGFEWLYGNASSFERLAHLRYSPLPGADKAVREPWRNAIGMILHYWPEEGVDLATQLFPERVEEVHIIKNMIDKKVNTPLAGTCGRLFDAVSAILGICLESTYEGEAAIQLSDFMNRTNKDEQKIYPYTIQLIENGLFQLDVSPMIYEIIQDHLHQLEPEKIIATFHETIISACVKMLLTFIKRRPTLNRNVILSGGSFQNLYLARQIKSRLKKEGFSVYTHKKVPCNDGGLSLGQLLIASQTINKPKTLD
ncbi:carbamoyltransferase HypF [Alkalihalobacterium elongatum]|uniref:carbamoyltransferase HypF n=1 Tax=Alkalihalobacterium elongatum TaxID=2675466 RepID=UPI001C1F7DA4|nr:carbamoyltransferase HypF [Alkalihalobacterium elongatum]